MKAFTSVLALAVGFCSAEKLDSLDLVHGYSVAYDTAQDTSEAIEKVDFPAAAANVMFRTTNTDSTGFAYVFAQKGGDANLPDSLDDESKFSDDTRTGDLVGPVGTITNGDQDFTVSLNTINGTGTVLHVTPAASCKACVIDKKMRYDLGVIFSDSNMKPFDIPILVDRRSMLLNSKKNEGEVVEYWFSYTATAADISGGGKMYASLSLGSTDKLSDALSFIWKKADAPFVYNMTTDNKFPEVTPKTGNYVSDSMKMDTVGKYYFGLYIEKETGSEVDFSVKFNVNELPTAGAMGSPTLSFAALLFVVFALVL